MDLSLQLSMRGVDCQLSSRHTMPARELTPSTIAKFSLDAIPSIIDELHNADSQAKDLSPPRHLPKAKACALLDQRPPSRLRPAAPP